MMNTEVTREDVERFESNAAAAQDYVSASVCSYALGEYPDVINTRYPCTEWSRVDELLGTIDPQQNAWALASKWVLAARAMED